MQTMTAAQWKAKHSDFKSIINEQKFVLANDPKTGGTMLVPVAIARVGGKVTTSGYPGTITRLLPWTTSMITVRLASGVVCVGVEDCDTVEG